MSQRETFIQAEKDSMNVRFPQRDLPTTDNVEKIRKNIFAYFFYFSCFQPFT